MIYSITYAYSMQPRNDTWAIGDDLRGHTIHHFVEAGSENQFVMAFDSNDKLIGEFHRASVNIIYK